MTTAKDDEAIAFAEKFLSPEAISAAEKRIIERPQSEADLEFMILGLRRIAEDPDNPDTLGFDYLMSLAAGFQRSKYRVPDFLAAFAADVLEGKRKRPTKRGADPYAKYRRNYALFEATEAVAKEFDLPCYSNNELSEKTTAAEIVSMAEHCTTDIVVTAYKKCKKRREDWAKSKRLRED